MISPARIAQVSIGNEGTTFGLGTANLQQSVINFIQWTLGLLGLIAVVMFLVGAVDWVISGDSEVVKIRARRIMVGAIAGLIVVLLAWAIVIFVVDTTENVTK